MTKLHRLQLSPEVLAFMEGSRPDAGGVHYASIRLRPRARPLRSPVVNPTWYVIATNPKCEEKAKQGLEELGYRVFLPMETIWVKVPEHRQKAKGCKKEKVDRPLFRGYLFFGLDKGVHPFEPAHMTDGVASIIRTGGEYMPVASTIINRLMAAVETGNHDTTAKEAEKLLGMIGQQVTIMEGPLVGFIATVLKATTQELQLELEAFGKRIKTRLPLANVETTC
jgi:transcription antitermination factor NusG